ncbi:hypothetical protein SEA_PHARAOH_77 [Mycobacterium phage Pharaoh]|uniref:Uncharacterized protein n=1 Tax=Mycobacterium phage Pharaoh TaxID=2530140 RepID=A0A481W258_9CAUD|nr:site-specific recombination directionality factor RDF [Mycobacterium phage Pharaoh]QBJ00265.1 hypothetical protein SEA_PHARAOH_77 [Mycobacterium phage Pharaoh]
MTRILAAAVMLAASAVAVLAIASPPAHAVTPSCEVRTQAHYERYGGLWKDSAEHVLRGELPTCDPSTPQTSQGQEAHDEDHHDGDKKSRHCRKSWYC